MLTIEKVYQENKKSVNAWMKSCHTAGGKLKRNIFFGTQCKEPIKAGQTLVWIGASYASSNGPETDRSIELVKLLSKSESVRIFSENKQTAESLQQAYPTMVVEQEREALGLLATCENVVSVAMLPILYRKRSGQRHIHLVTGSDLTSSRYERMMSGLGCVFSADWIVAQSLDEVDRFANIYQLKDAFEGSLTWADQDSLAERVFQVLDSNDKEIPCISYDNSKKKILLFTDCCPSNRAGNYCRHLIKLIDFDAYDVSVICQCYDDKVNAYQFVEDLDERVRAFSRSGSFSCDAESYVAIQVINEIILDKNNPIELLNLLPSSALEDEIDRMLPGMKFDSFVYCARDRKLWTLLSSSIRAGHKTMIQLEYRSTVLKTTDDEEKVLAFESKAKLISTVFESVGFANSEMKAGMSPYLEDTDVWVWNDVVPILASASTDSISNKGTTIDGARYQIVRDGGNIQKGIINAYIYRPLLAEKPHYLTFAHIDEMTDLAQTLDRDDRDYAVTVFVENSVSLSLTQELPENTDDTRFVDMGPLVNSTLMPYYMAGFDGYLEFSSMDNSVKALASSIGLPVVSEQSGKLQIKQAEAEGLERFSHQKSFGRVYGL